MRKYELILIVHPELDEAAFNEIVERVNGWIIDGGGEVTETALWGTKKLAYPIRKQNEGQYIFMKVRFNPAFGNELERNLRFIEPILRFSLISVD